MMKTMLAGAVACLVGCSSSGYTDFYKAEAAVPERHRDPGSSIHLIVSDGYAAQEANALVYRKHKVIGRSAFIDYLNSKNSNIAAVRQAIDVGADVVILNRPEYMYSVTETHNVPHCITSTITTTSNGNGEIGSTPFTYGGHSTSTVNSYYTTQESETYGMYKFMAIYLVGDTVQTIEIEDDSRR